MPENETRPPATGVGACKAVVSSPWMGSEGVIELIQARNLSALRTAIEANPKDAEHPRAILEASRVAWKDGIRLLLAAGADPEQHGAWPSARALVIAAFQGERQYVAELLKAGARQDGFTAAALGDVEGVRRAIEEDGHFPSARDGGRLTALQCCAGSRMGRNDPQAAANLLAAATLLLNHGADVNAKTKSWDHDVDAIYFASASGQREIYMLLLDRGANADAALISAMWRGNMEFAAIALRKGADVDRAQDGGRPLLNQLVRWGQIQPALWLLDRGASPNIPDARGWTAVHQAASRGNERMMQALLKAGADLAIKDAEGRRPVDVARAMKKPRIVQLLH